MNPSHAVLIDSSILIDHLRTKNKSNSVFCQLLREFKVHYLSPIIQYEILCGNTPQQHPGWVEIAETMFLLPFDSSVSEKGAMIYRELKAKSMLVDHLDMMIAATALANDVPLATLNRKHFERIDDLKLV